MRFSSSGLPLAAGQCSQPRYQMSSSGEDDNAHLERRRRLQRRLRVLVASRRRVVAAGVHLVSSGQGPQGSKRPDEDPFSWTDHVARLSEDEFKQRYRLTFDAFYQMLQKIRPALDVNEKMAKVGKWGHVVEPQVKLAIALRFLAGGAPLDLKLIYHVSKSYV